VDGQVDQPCVLPVASIRSTEALPACELQLSVGREGRIGLDIARRDRAAVAPRHRHQLRLRLLVRHIWMFPERGGGRGDPSDVTHREIDRRF
jgi:hypothetical protein